MPVTIGKPPVKVEVKQLLVTTVSSYDSLSPESLTKLKILSKRMANPTPLNFLGYINLTRGEFLGLCAIIMTYIIMLMQFKQAGF